MRLRPGRPSTEFRLREPDGGRRAFLRRSMVGAAAIGLLAGPAAAQETDPPHEDDTTDVHGISDTSRLVLTDKSNVFEPGFDQRIDGRLGIGRNPLDYRFEVYGSTRQVLDDASPSGPEHIMTGANGEWVFGIDSVAPIPSRDFFIGRATHPGVNDVLYLAHNGLDAPASAGFGGVKQTDGFGPKFRLSIDPEGASYPDQGGLLIRIKSGQQAKGLAIRDHYSDSGAGGDWFAVLADGSIEARRQPSNALYFKLDPATGTVATPLVTSARADVKPAQPSDAVLTLRALPGQTGNYLEVRAADSSFRQTINAYGATTWFNAAGAPSAAIDASAGALRVSNLTSFGNTGAYLATPGTRVQVQQRNASHECFVVFGAPGQLADIVGVRDGAGGVLSRFNKNGYFMTRKTAAPSDAELANGELALWLDATPQTAAVMFKAKDSSGKVRTARLDLK